MISYHLQDLLKFSMRPFFKESKYSTHLDEETYQRNYVEISIIHNAIKNIEDEFNKNNNENNNENNK